MSLAVFLLLSFSSFSEDINTVTVLVEFNGVEKNITEQVQFIDEITALEALMHVAKVQTHPAGGYVFVDAVNNSFNKKGENAWYYKINGEFAKQLAIHQPLVSGDTLTWIYKQDVCSKTIKK